MPDGTVIAALIAAAASFAAAVFALVASQGARTAVDRQRSEDYRVRQLTELYGPLYMQRQTTLRLVKQLRGDARDWHLLDHIKEIREEENPRRSEVVEEILNINEQSSDLIITKAGLLESFPPPASFEEFLTHARTLRMAWEQGVDALDVNYVTHPEAFDSDVLNATRLLQQDLRAMRPARGTSTSRWQFWN